MVRLGGDGAETRGVRQGPADHAEGCGGACGCDPEETARGVPIQRREAKGGSRGSYIQRCRVGVRVAATGRSAVGIRVAVGVAVGVSELLPMHTLPVMRRHLHPRIPEGSLGMRPRTRVMGTYHSFARPRALSACLGRNRAWRWGLTCNAKYARPLKFLRPVRLNV